MLIFYSFTTYTLHMILTCYSFTNYTLLDDTIYTFIFLLAFRVHGSNDYSSNRAMKFGTKQIAVHLGHRFR